ncbi:DNA mismatch repair protein MutL [Exophiala viscosa]|uniref:DNA mismatch repair protein MutL n=1 Tax=Exophiala viscosa TaxID=2486360 RepID=UPI0021936BA2|nr:DNA mismatch repair protein MutL [Exophiala viscosa]
MAIEALPENTIRVIGSSLVLNDAKSVVKELVDNALDARATAVSIEIANNTLDVIQVKDNGTGIDIQDRQLLCKRGCTSKIRNLDDLARLGGSFLGFRGEALSSIAELSRDVVVTTRVDGEVVATSLKYVASGMLSSSSASHPVGTTVRVQDLLTNIPVRRQTALKATIKTLQAIKNLLFAFAFARPDVRFSLKVLKGKNEKLNWTYAASRNDSLAEVAAKIVGKEVAAECTECKVSSIEVDDQIDDGWEIQALLVSADADLTKVRNGPQFISVDGRPVSMDRGTMKEIAKTYKHHLQRIFSGSNNTSISRLFTYMQIRCPPESYDVNIEPAKDEVLFFRPKSLLSLIETLLQKAYPGNAATAGETQVSEKSSVTVSAGDTPHKDMYHIDLDDMELPVSPTGGILAQQESEPEDRPTALRNPFTIAAMNRIISPKKMDETHIADQMQPSTQDLTQHHTPVVTHTRRIPLGPGPQPPSPVGSETQSMPYQNPGPPLRPWAKAARRSVDEETDPPAPRRHSPDTSPERTSLQDWLTPVSGQRQRLTHRAGGLMGSEARSPAGPQPPLLATNANRDSGPSVRASSFSADPSWGPGQRPFKSPLKRLTQGRLQESSGLPSPASPIDIPCRTTEGSEHSSALDAELTQIMDFERRKKAAIARHKELANKSSTRSIKELLSRPGEPGNIGNSVSNSDDRSVADFDARFGRNADIAPEPPEPKSTPHHNRYLAARRDLSHAHPPPSAISPFVRDTEDNDSSHKRLPDQPSDRPRLSDDDPRAYLMKQQQRLKAGNSRLYRSKSSKLPFESFSPDAMTLNLVVTTNTFEDVVEFRTYVQTFATTDRYIRSGEMSYENLLLCDMTIDDDCANALREVVKAQYRYKNLNGEGLVPHMKIAISKETINQDKELLDV